VRQGDALACLLFNTALEKVIQDSGIQTRGTIFFKTVQILAFADDIDLLARTTLGLNEAFLNLEKSARNMGLVISQEKTVYMYKWKGHNIASGHCKRKLSVNKNPTRCNSMQIFIYFKVTLHVSGVTAPIISTKNCNRSLRYR